MGRLIVVLDPGVVVTPADLATAWESDEETRAVGTATVETAAPGDFFGVLELVVVPLAVNLATNVITVPDFVPDGAVVEIHAEGPTGEQKPYIVRIYEDDGTIKNPFTPEKKIFHRAQNP